ncbi:hypothetical protein ABZP36_032192, partial [Zizania latifolia]
MTSWICYAEKTLGSYILPYISSVKSPQHAIDAAIKHHMYVFENYEKRNTIFMVMQSKSVDFKTLEESPLDRLLINVDDDVHLYGVSGGSGAHVPVDREIQGPLDFRIIRNSDFREVTLEVEGKSLLKFALCYGFRNLQNIVRKIKIGKCEYHFIEVMACSSGCLNGGGQIKLVKGQSAKDLIQLLE